MHERCRIVNRQKKAKTLKYFNASLTNPTLVGYWNLISWFLKWLECCKFMTRIALYLLAVTAYHGTCSQECHSTMYSKTTEQELRVDDNFLDLKLIAHIWLLDFWQIPGKNKIHKGSSTTLIPLNSNYTTFTGNTIPLLIESFHILVHQSAFIKSYFLGIWGSIKVRGRYSGCGTHHIIIRIVVCSCRLTVLPAWNPQGEIRYIRATRTLGQH